MKLSSRGIGYLIKTYRFLLSLPLLLGSLQLLWLSIVSAQQDLRIELVPHLSGIPIEIHQSLHETAGGDRVSISRLDFLLSEGALQRNDGSWLETGNWFAYCSLEEQRLSTELYQVPSGEYQAIRFRLGVPEDENHGDPNQVPPGHPLHPLVNGLHWDWQSGYIFLALEGHIPSSNESKGFSYHLGNDENSVFWELPVRFHADETRTIQLALHLDEVFPTFPLESFGLSTHSRLDDPIARHVADGLRSAISLMQVSSDEFQNLSSSPRDSTDRPILGRPYPLSITRRFPEITFPKDNPLTIEGVSLGKRLFHDTQLSSDHTLSCASCHLSSHALSDPRSRSLGVGGAIGRRNAMPLFNLAWHNSFLWDGRASTLREQALLPIEDPTEMNESLPRVISKLRQPNSSYPDHFLRAFGSPEISPESIGLALEQFLLTQVSQDSKFDLAVRGEDQFTPLESRGLQLFITEYDPANNLYGADCFHCHSGNLFTNLKFANNGLDREFTDLGRFEVTGLPQDRGRFKTPSLRNVELTAPYMHDGRFQTLEEVVRHYSEGVQPSNTLDPNLAKHLPDGIRLSLEDQEALVAFLKTLTDPSFPSYSDDSAP